MLWGAVTLKLLCEIALLALAARAVVGWLARPQPQHNPVWQLLSVIVRPVERLATGWLPAGTGPRSRALATGALLAGLWLAATLLKVSACAGSPVCR
jgi:hypothetical protein